MIGKQMPKDIRLHGTTENHIEYFAFLAGADVCERYAFNIGRENDAVFGSFLPETNSSSVRTVSATGATAAPSANTCSASTSLWPTWRKVMF